MQTMQLTLDRRERRLSAALEDLELAHALASLAVGDVHCKYADGTEWILERKTVIDLAQSIRLGLCHAACVCPCEFAALLTLPRLRFWQVGGTGIEASRGGLRQHFLCCRRGLS